MAKNQPTQSKAEQPKQEEQASKTTMQCPPEVAAKGAALDWQNLPVKEFLDFLMALKNWWAARSATSEGGDGGAQTLTPQVMKDCFPDCPDAVCQCCCDNIKDAMSIVGRSIECCQTTTQ